MHIYKSPFPDLGLPELSATEWVFQGLELAKNKTFLTDTTTGRAMTGAQAMDDIRALAGGFIAKGLQKGEMVAIMAPNLLEYFTVFHAVAYAGGVVTMVNPTYTADELRHQVEAVSARFVVTTPGLVELAAKGTRDTTVQDIVTIGGTVDGAISLESLMGTPLARQLPVDLVNDLVVVPFSSGTTGLPKGVMLTHRNLVANAVQWQSAKNMHQDDVTPSFLPFFHIFGLSLTFMVYPGSGASIHTMHRFDLETYLQLAQDTKAQRLWLVPPIAIALAQSPIVDTYDLSAIQSISSGAAPLSVEIGKAVAKRINCQFAQGYGMTEVAGASHVMPSDAPKEDSLGALVANSTCRIVDPDTKQDQSVDQSGEIWIKGPQVMKGYLNDPTETARLLSEDGWFQTGDIGSVDADGHLRIHDRLKEMIKVNGFPVAPAEVEAALANHPKVLDAAVVGVPHDESGEAPKAFIVPIKDHAPDLEELQDFLAERLARYKNIRFLDIVPSIPRSPSGKILRRVLRDNL